MIKINFNNHYMIIGNLFSLINILLSIIFSWFNIFIQLKNIALYVIILNDYKWLLIISLFTGAIKFSLQRIIVVYKKVC
jgi:hypothetical protein